MNTKGVLPPTYLFLAIVVMVAFHFLFPKPKVIRSPWNLFGSIPLASGLFLNFIADRAFKNQGTTVKPFEEPAALITGGVFRVSRNPMYLGFLLILIGIGVFLGSLTPFLVIIAFAIFNDIVFIRVEERMLEEKFGQVWQEYKRKVRRWL